MQHETAASPALATTHLQALGERINRAHEQCAGALRASLQHALEAGRLLREVKAQVPHGSWLPWPAANMTVPERTARLYMRWAREVPGRLEADKRATVADLSVREAVALLASPELASDEDRPANPLLASAWGAFREYEALLLGSSLLDLVPQASALLATVRRCVEQAMALPRSTGRPSRRPIPTTAASTNRPWP